MMRTEEFPRDRWESYLNDLTRKAKDRPVQVRVESLAIGDQVLAEGLPLVAISLETKGTDKGAIEIVAERPDGTHVMHMIPDPQRIYLARDERGEVVALDVEEEGGVKTLIALKN